MKLVSTFHDYYDPFFDGRGRVFERTGGNVGPPKREQFSLLTAAGYMVPPHGTVGEILGGWWDGEQKWVKHVVAYTNEQAHCGEGKVVFGEGQLKSNPDMGAPGGDRFWRERALYCSAFVGDYYQRFGRGCSVRRLQVGPHVFWVEYRSTESWMSNVGDGSCEVVGVEKGVGFHPAIPLPLFAIDFVLGKEMYAVDFNSAPGIRGSGVEKYLPGPEAVEAIEGWFAHEGPGPGRSNAQPGPDRPGPAGE
jgi:hypothetical protein